MGKSWTPLTILLIVIIVLSGIFAWSRYRLTQAQEISIATSYPSEMCPGKIYINGAVANPGFYPLKANDSIETLVQAAGGATVGTDSSLIKLKISQVGDQEAPQRINLNRAETWLLEALPGIGEERAKAIVDYRLEQGPFVSINELTKVTGIGAKTFEQVKPLICVAD